MNPLKLRRRSLCMALPAMAVLALAACSEKEAGAVASSTFGIPSSLPATRSAIKEHGRGFTVGQLMSANEVFVFFDPRCPHCAMFWLQTEALRNRLKFTWLPVAIMGTGSAAEGASILAAEDKVKAMTAHATKVIVAMKTNTRLPGASTDSGDSNLLTDIARNTRLFSSFGADSVPYVVAVNREGSTVLSRTGVTPEQLTAALGLTTAR